MAMTFEEALAYIRETSANESEKGKRFEQATRYFFMNDPLWSPRLSETWAWADAPTNDGQDIGIDLVAQDAEDGSYWAIQCKAYDDAATLDYKTLSTFFSTAAASNQYKNLAIVDTAADWSSNLQKIADQYKTIRINQQDLSASSIDWQPFIEGKASTQRAVYEPRPHQVEAIDACVAGFHEHDRGQLIMACGTGKTLTALRLAEKMYPEGSFVLFMAPSISLVAQTLREWANQA